MQFETAQVVDFGGGPDLAVVGVAGPGGSRVAGRAGDVMGCGDGGRG